MLAGELARAIRNAVVIVVIAAGWIVVKLWSGFPLLELVAFVAPGIVIGVTMNWLAHAFDRADWNWENALVGAFVGATIMPPLIGFLSALVGTYGSGALVPVFVLGSWIALFGALIYGALRSGIHRRRSAPVAHITRLGE